MGFVILAGVSLAAREEVLALMRELEARPAHVTHVVRLALQLFDGLVSVHGLGERARLLLEAAAHLHDIGHQYEHLGTGHHKESARLILERHWKEFSPDETRVIAQIARYHRGPSPKLKHEEFAALSPSGQELVRRLAAILRLADSLDRNHEQFVGGVTVDVHSDRLVLNLEAGGPVLMEVIKAHQKGDLAREVFRRELIFTAGGQVIKPEFPR